MRVILALLCLFCATAAFAAGESELDALKTYCKPDIERLCPKVEPGNGALKKCLKDHEMQISVGCAQALKTLKN